jgi:hypothetical protein
MKTEPISKRPLLPSLTLNPAVSGKHFETASTDDAFNKLRWHIYITPVFCQEINQQI